MPLPEHLFANITNLATLQEDIHQSQKDHNTTLCLWEVKHHLTRTSEGWYKDHRLVVVKDNILRKGVTHLIHASDMAGHLGLAKTLTLLNRNYWWPGMKNFATQYIKGCTLCQSHKNITTRPKPLQFPITTNPEVQLFKCIALDFITKLPPSEDYNCYEPISYFFIYQYKHRHSVGLACTTWTGVSREPAYDDDLTILLTYLLHYDALRLIIEDSRLRTVQ